MNNCTFTGNITRDAELRFTQGGMAIASFTLAVNRGFGEKQTTAFLGMVLFGKRAESLVQHLTKGSKVGVVAEVSQSSWEQDGQKRSKLEFIVNDLELMGGARPSDKLHAPKAEYAPPELFEGDDLDDVPF